MRRIDALRTLALSSALILTLGGTCGTSEEDTSDTSEPSRVKVFPPVKVTPPPVAPGEYVDPFAEAPGEFVESYPEEYVDPYPGVDRDGLGPVDAPMQPAPATLE